MFLQCNRLRVSFVPQEWDFCSCYHCCGWFGVRRFLGFAEFDLLLPAPFHPACVSGYSKKIPQPPFPPHVGGIHE